MKIKSKVESGNGRVRVLEMADGTYLIQRRFLFFFWESVIKLTRNANSFNIPPA